MGADQYGAGGYYGGPQPVGADPYGASDPFGAAPGAQAAATKTLGAPTPWLFVSMGLAAASAAVAYLVTKQTVLALAPWAVAAFGAFGSLSVFSYVNAKREADPEVIFRSNPATKLMYAVAAALAVAAVVATAVQVGFWAARL
jgi:hypothetical protein